MSSADDTGRDLFVDTDTLGINDDALALYYLFALGRAPRLITTVFGNATAAASARHAQALARAHALGVDVVRGCERPVWWNEPSREHVRAAVAALPAATYLASLRADNHHFWGSDVKDGPAPDALARALRRSQGADVLAIGPVTNIARAVRVLDPPVLARHCLWIAGGALTGGNVTDDAEFNAFADPEALQWCLSVGWRAVVMVPLEIMAAPRLLPAAVSRVRLTRTPLGAALDILERASPRGESTDREPIWDVVAAALLADKTLSARQVTGMVTVSTDPPHRGRIRFTEGAGTHHLVTDIDPEAVARRFEAVVSRPRRSP